MSTLRLVVCFAIFVAFCTFLVGATEDYPDGCTAMIVGKRASADGSVITTHTADCKECDSRVFYVPASDTTESMRPVFLGGDSALFAYPRYIGKARGPGYKPSKGQVETQPIGYIPQVKHTFAYFDSVYGVMNENQVAIGESTCASKIYAFPKTKGGEALLDINELSRIALERALNATHALDIITSLAEEYGFYAGWNAPHSTAGESLTITDPNEAWVLHMLASPCGKSAVWAAARVPDDEVAVVANRFIIRQLDLSDPTRFRASSNLLSVAKENGFWNPENEPFDFLKAFSPNFDMGDYHYQPRYSDLRMWRVMDVIAPSKGITADMTYSDFPFSIKPDQPVTVQTIMSLNRDIFENTEYDLTRGMGAGPFGTPSRYGKGKGEDIVKGAWARPISLYRTSYSTVLQSRSWLPNAVGGIMWMGMDQPHTSVYVPFYAGITEVAEPFHTGHMLEFNRKSAWWAFDFLANWAEFKFNLMFQDIRAKQQEIESRQFSEMPELEDKAVALIHTHKSNEARSLLTKWCTDNANNVVDTWWKFADFMVVKYNDGYINYPKPAVNSGYPAWWLKSIGWDNDAHPKWIDGITDEYPNIPVADIRSPASNEAVQSTFSTGVSAGVLTMICIVASALAGAAGFMFGYRRQQWKRSAKAHYTIPASVKADGYQFLTQETS